MNPTADSTVTMIVRSAGASNGSAARSASIETFEPSVQSNLIEAMYSILAAWHRTTVDQVGLDRDHFCFMAVG